MFLKSSPPPDVLSRDSYGVLSCLKGVHFLSTCADLSEAGQRGGVASRPSSAMPLEERSVASATDPSCISATDSKMCSASEFYYQTVGLNEGLVRMFKWIRNRMSCSDGGSQILRVLPAKGDLCHFNCIVCDFVDIRNRTNKGADAP